MRSLAVVYPLQNQASRDAGGSAILCTVGFRSLENSDHLAGRQWAQWPLGWTVGSHAAVSRKALVLVFEAPLAHMLFSNTLQLNTAALGLWPAYPVKYQAGYRVPGPSSPRQSVHTRLVASFYHALEDHNRTGKQQRQETKYQWHTCIWGSRRGLGDSIEQFQDQHR